MPITLNCAYVFFRKDFEISIKLLKFNGCLFNNNSPTLESYTQGDYHSTLWQFDQCPLAL